ncbi:MAG TPA: transcription-repair coupling factor [Polyangiaceae bacterium]|jgi:transcription-repair coupling factor (superfamily II helicase)|nr:transcription-repair coupling factor [Polyangiaceae bacterium]
MPSSPTLTSTLEEQTGLSARLSEASAAVVAEHEPLPSLLPPEGVVASRVRDVAARVKAARTGAVDVAGVRGSAGAALAAAIARAGRRVVFVTADLEGARRAAEDVGFFVRGASDDDAEESGRGEVLVFAASEASPYAEVSPDRRAAMSRMATLFHLAHDLPWRVLVVPASGLTRKVVPRKELAKRADRIAVDTEIDRDRLVRSLSEAGYLRVPVVEDAGGFAVRGALLDVWPPSAESPVRVELYGELVLSMKPFDPIEQKTRKDAPDIKVLWLPPVREAILDAGTTTRARERVTQLAEAIDWPTTKTRALVDDVTNARAFFGAEGFLPAYYDDLEGLLGYVPRDAVVVLEDPPALTQAIRGELERAAHDVAAESGPSFLPNAFYRDEAEVVAGLEAHAVVALHRTAIAGAPGEGLSAYESARDPLDLASYDQEDLTRAIKAARSSKGKNASLTPLVRRLAHWQSHGLRVFVTARAQTQAERIATLLRHQGVECKPRLTPFDPAWLDAAPASAVEIVVGPLSRGVVMPAEGLVLVTEEEIFGARVHRRKERSKAGDPSRPFIEDLRSLAPGDYVVHAEHGIGRYQGLVHKAIPGGHTVDLIAIEYGGGDKLYLPVWRLNQLGKYMGGEHGSPKLDKLGGSTFARTKARVAREVRKMADELLKLYAERQALEGNPLPPADDDYRAFEASFPFDETADQARAIDDVNRDLEAPRPMDRLVCGDVGFGKTEVALRAAFRAAMAGRQVALLCPTTVLAQQHFRTFETRSAGYPIQIRALSRFQTKKEQEEALAGLKEGKVDVVVGTHRLLSKDVHFRNLGLLVVDEEQRFGVSHKERIKQIRAQVDVLTLTATPIPRTLQMAVTGLRDLSLITTAPVDRRAVRTVVTRWDDQVVREAVTRELARGGQCFYVYNRIDKLYEKAQRLQELVPSARIAVAHGQMGEAALEEAMLDFVDGRYDVLVSTAIVESGLDIPRANTMIIDRADLFGLAQLYQLRGRVGRSRERAYCYLVVPPANALTDEARARIEALERHTELGSGFQVATLDMELRGAGDLLGGEQSGNVASVGFDMFCRMLDEAVHEMRGEEVAHDVDTELSFDVEALLPEDYVTDVGVRLSLYKRLASAVDESHVSEIAAEMEDRFGAPPDEARRLVKLMALKTELRRLRALGCEANARVVTLHLRDDTPLDPGKITALMRTSRGAWKLTPDMRLTRRFTSGDGIANAEAALAELAGATKDGR